MTRTSEQRGANRSEDGAPLRDADTASGLDVLRDGPATPHREGDTDMNRKTPTTITALLLGLGLSVGAAEALEIVDVKKAPSWYATEVVQTEQGQEVRRAVFGTQPAGISMEDLNRVLEAYGVVVVDAKRAPGGYMREIVSSVGGERTVVFDPQPKGIAPAAVDGILAAYGLRIVDAKKLPPSYGREVVRTDADGKEVRDVVLGTAAYAISPAEWNTILSAYGS
jgi:hypothetical protein